MPLWNPPPPDGGRSIPYRIIRVPAKGSIRGVITSIEPVACQTHYIAHRTIPCDGPTTCKACQQGHSARWHCYVTLILSATLEQVLLELTAAASEALRNYHTIHGGVRGCLLIASRPSGRSNGRVVAACTPAKIDGVTLPEPPNVYALLCHLWGIQYDPQEHAKSILDRRTRIAAPQPGNGDARYNP